MFRRFFQFVRAHFNRWLFRDLALAAIVCQTLASAGCTTERKVDGLVADMAAAHRAAIEAAEVAE